MSKLLSIAIPTLNRAEYLKFTLDNFIPQMQLYSEEAEIVVCNNASDDNTSEIENYYSKYEFIKFYDFEERFELGDNFKRTASLTQGRYFILWGDDDIPAPGLISYLLSLINDNPKIEFFHLNGLVGYEDGNPIKSLSVRNNYYENLFKIYSTPSDFIRERFEHATFMTSDLVSKELWERGVTIDTSNYYGYEFMAIIYFGNGNNPIYYANFPMFIQRKVAQRAWGPNWALYGLVGLPNLSIDLEKAGLYENGFNVWKKQYNGFIMFCYTLLNGAQYKERYRPLCKTFAKYQDGLLRKFLVYFIINCVPGFIYKLSRKLLFKFK